MGINMDEEGRPWTVSGGGPVIVVPAETAAAWRGTLPPVGANVPPGWTWGSPGGVECDYDRACDPQDSMSTGYGGFGWLDVGGKPALVLDAEITTTFFAEDGGGTIVRGSVAESNTDPASVSEWKAFPVSVIELGDGRLFMFDSAYAGDADPAQIKADDGVGVIALEPGTYQLTCGTNADEVDFVRLRKI